VPAIPAVPSVPASGSVSRGVGPDSGLLPLGWRKLGFGGDPVLGDPGVLQGVVEDFGYLRDVAWSVAQGLEAAVASSLSGGFAGEVAEALRGVVSGRLKAFVVNVGRAFSLAGEAVAQYRAVVVRAQQRAANAVAVGDARLVGLRGRVQGELDRVGAAARVLEVVLRDAVQMVSQPVEVPGVWGRVRGRVELALSVVGGVLGLLTAPPAAPIGSDWRKRCVPVSPTSPFRPTRACRWWRSWHSIWGSRNWLCTTRTGIWLTSGC
jgi:hypothetical protein